MPLFYAGFTQLIKTDQVSNHLIGAVRQQVAARIVKIAELGPNSHIDIGRQCQQVPH